MKFPDLTKDPADVVTYTMDWTSRLAQLGSPAPTIKSLQSISVNGDCQVADKTTGYPNVSVLSLQVSGGSDFGWTGDPQIANLSVVTVQVLLSDGQTVLSRSFNVVERML